MSDEMIHTESGVSVYTGEPFVKVDWGNLHAQMTPQEARDFAFVVLGAADAAESDAFIFKFMKEKVGAPEDHAAQVLVAFREYREGRQPPAEIPDAEK